MGATRRTWSSFLWTRGTRGHSIGYSEYWWLVQGDHKIQDTSVTGDQIHDTVIVGDQGVKVQGFRVSWGSDTESWGKDPKTGRHGCRQILVAHYKIKQTIYICLHNYYFCVAELTVGWPV